MDVRLLDRDIDQDKIEAFNTVIFGKTSIVKAKNTNSNPFGDGQNITVIAVHEGVIVGHLTSTPFGLWVQGKEKLAYWMSGFHVLPIARGMGVGKKLVACANDLLPLSSAVVVVAPSLRAFKSNGWVWPSMINDYVHIANPNVFLTMITIDRLERFLPKGTKVLLQIILKLMRIPLGWGIKLIYGLLGVKSKVKKGRTLAIEKVEEFGPEIDTLWEKNKHHYELTHVRNAENINWQFPTNQGWEKFVYRSQDRLAVNAWGLYKIKRYADGGPLDGLIALNIIDAFWDVDKPGVLAELYQYILHLGYSKKVDIIMVSGNLPTLNRLLKKTGFLRIPSTVYVGFSDPQLAKEGTQAIYGLSYITRGYADAAGGLGS